MKPLQWRTPPARRAGTLTVFALLLLSCGQAAPFRARDASAGQNARLTPTSGLLVIEAAVNGESVPLVLDLGNAHPLTLPHDVLDRVDARPTGETDVYRDAAGNTLTTPVYEIAELRWAGVTWHGVRAVEARWSPDYAPPVRAGVLGLPLVDGLRVALRVGDGTVSIGASAPCPKRGIPLDPGYGTVADGRLDDEPVRVLLDTAATGNIATSHDRAGRHRLFIGDRDLGTVELIGAELPAVPADAILGTPFLARYSEVVVDLGAACLVVE